MKNITGKEVNDLAAHIAKITNKDNNTLDLAIAFSAALATLYSLGVTHIDNTPIQLYMGA